MRDKGHTQQKQREKQTSEERKKEGRQAGREAVTKKSGGISKNWVIGQDMSNSKSLNHLACSCKYVFCVHVHNFMCTRNVYLTIPMSMCMSLCTHVYVSHLRACVCVACSVCCGLCLFARLFAVLLFFTSAICFSLFVF